MRARTLLLEKTEAKLIRAFKKIFRKKLAPTMKRFCGRKGKDCQVFCNFLSLPTFFKTFCLEGAIYKNEGRLRKVNIQENWIQSGFWNRSNLYSRKSMGVKNLSID